MGWFFRVGDRALHFVGDSPGVAASVCGSRVCHSTSIVWCAVSSESGFKRSGAVALSIGTFCGAASAIFVGLIVPPFITQFQQLVELVPKGLDNLQNRFQDMQNMIPGYSQYVPGVDDLIRQIQPLAARVVGNFFAWFSNALAIVLNLYC